MDPLQSPVSADRKLKKSRIQRSQTGLVGDPYTLPSGSRLQTGNAPPRQVEKTYSNTRTPAARKDLGQQITFHMKKVGEIALGLAHDYLPDDELTKLLIDEDIQKAFGRPLSREEKIWAQANPKVLALTLLVHTDRNKKDRILVMETFMTYELTDQDLPYLENMSSEEVCWERSGESEMDGSSNRSNCWHNKKGYAFHISAWGDTSIASFLKMQWYFSVPVFDQEIFQYSFGNSYILPFKRDKYSEDESSRRLPGSGHFGHVACVKMLAKHQNAVYPVSCSH